MRTVTCRDRRARRGVSEDGEAASQKARDEGRSASKSAPSTVKGTSPTSFALYRSNGSSGCAGPRTRRMRRARWWGVGDILYPPTDTTSVDDSRRAADFEKPRPLRKPHRPKESSRPRKPSRSRTSSRTSLGTGCDDAPFMAKGQSAPSRPSLAEPAWQIPTRSATPRRVARRRSRRHAAKASAGSLPPRIRHGISGRRSTNSLRGWSGRRE